MFDYRSAVLVRSDICLQYLNNKLVSLEGYVTSNPWHTAFYALIGLVLLVLGLRKLLADTEDSREGGYLRKGGRLD